MRGTMRAGLTALLLTGASTLQAQAPTPPDNGPALRAEMTSLGIDPATMRQGADGNNPNAPNAANYDEAKVRAFSLPALMGEMPPIDANGWAERRARLVELVEDNLVGRIPDAAASVKVDWTVLKAEKKDVGGIKAVVRTMRGATSMPDGRKGPVIEAEITTPEKPAAGKMPAVIDYTFVFPANLRRPAPANGAAPPAPPPSPAVTALKRGWAYVAYYPYSVQADNGAGLKDGIIGLVNGGKVRGPTEWGALRAWGWGASRLADLLQADAAIDGTRLAVAGLSRFGKATLVTTAFDDRFASALVGSSGAGGAKLLRRNFGELVENLEAGGEFHWFAPAFLRYAGPRTVDDLPVDSHMLIALVAPRPLFIGTGVREQGDGWVDPRGNYLAAVAAAPAWQLLGKTGPTDPAQPAVDRVPPLTTLTWRQHSGGHTNAPNWEAYLDWTDKMWGRMGN
ncbi:MAG: hypothetical protein J7494_04275 [Sphingobium sp.]|nr:hypothetical protein [Sphingobium sp.]